VTSIDVLIEYKIDGQPTVYAECPGCQAVIKPA